MEEMRNTYKILFMQLEVKRQLQKRGWRGNIKINVRRNLWSEKSQFEI
jgi:hypothetical protein